MTVQELQRQLRGLPARAPVVVVTVVGESASEDDIKEITQSHSEASGPIVFLVIEP